MVLRCCAAYILVVQRFGQFGWAINSFGTAAEPTSPEATQPASTDTNTNGNE